MQLILSRSLPHPVVSAAILFPFPAAIRLLSLLLHHLDNSNHPVDETVTPFAFCPCPYYRGNRGRPGHRDLVQALLQGSRQPDGSILHHCGLPTTTITLRHRLQRRTLPCGGCGLPMGSLPPA